MLAPPHDHAKWKQRSTRSAPPCRTASATALAGSSSTLMPIMADWPDLIRSNSPGVASAGFWTRRRLVSASVGQPTFGRRANAQGWLDAGSAIVIEFFAESRRSRAGHRDNPTGEISLVSKAQLRGKRCDGARPGHEPSQRTRQVKLMPVALRAHPERLFEAAAH